jgi:hypothetical protein
MHKQIGIEELITQGFLDGFCKKMGGVIEYDAPGEYNPDYVGSFTLKNDPKPARFGGDNILYCGSKLYSDGVIGMVLFTGKNTRIFQQNMIENTYQKMTKSKKQVLHLLKYPIYYIHFGWVLILAFIYCLLIFSNERQLEVVLFIEGYQSRANGYIFKTVSTLVYLSQWTPMYLVFIIDLASITICFIVETNMAVGTFSNRWGRRKMSVEVTGSVSDDKGEDNDMLIMPSNKDIGDGRFKGGEVLRSLNQIDNEPESGYTGEKRMSQLLEHPVIHSTSSIGSQPRSKPNQAEQSNITMVNLDQLFCLANADHIIFDKTDTLTRGLMRVGKMSTRRTDYKLDVPHEKLEMMLDESKRNYAKYALSDSDEDKDNEEMDNYSEKSQE